VLSALNGLKQREADNVSRGIDENGQVRLKPYKNVTDILDVQGIGPEEYAKLSNLVTTRSDQFRVQIMAEALSDVDQNGVFDATDQILAHTVMDVVIDRKELNDDDPETSRFKLLMKQ